MIVLLTADELVPSFSGVSDVSGDTSTFTGVSLASFLRADLANLTLDRLLCLLEFLLLNHTRVAVHFRTMRNLEHG